MMMHQKMSVATMVAGGAMMMMVMVAVMVSPAASASLPTCCNDLDGNPLPHDCTCVPADTTLWDQHVGPGEYRYYHFVLTDYSVINVPDEERPELTMEVSPCEGSTYILAQGPSLQSDPFPSLESTLWNSSSEYEPNSITVTLVAAQYFISVYGSENSTFAIHTKLDESKFPAPGGNGTVVAVPKQTEELLLSGDPISMDVTFFTAETSYGDEGDYEYRIYRIPVIEGEPCGEENVTSTPECILSSHCGVESVMEPASDWIKFPTSLGQNVTIEAAGLIQNQEYTFTVSVRHPNGNVASYTGTRGTPTYERVGQAASDKTILIIGLSAAGVFVLLVGCIVWAKFRLNKAFRERRLNRQYKSIAPNEKAAAKEAKSGAGGGAGAGAGVGAGGDSSSKGTPQ